MADIRWADVIMVMEQKHKQRLTADFALLLENKPIHVLDIPDDYQYMDRELIDCLEEVLPPLLETYQQCSGQK